MKLIGIGDRSKLDGVALDLARDLHLLVDELGGLHGIGYLVNLLVFVGDEDSLAPGLDAR